MNVIDESVNNESSLVDNEEMPIGDEGSCIIDNSQILENNTPLVNKVLKFEKLQFRDQTSIMLKEKGEPILNQVTPFQ